MNQPTLWNYALGDLADANELKDTAPEQGRVSLRNLFQEINAIPVANGGIAPRRKDINCLFKAIGEHIFFIQRGGQYNWQADVTYPKNAVITYSNTEYKAMEENTGMVPNLNPDIWKPLVEVTPEKLQEALDALPKYTSASTTNEGLVKLSNDTESESEETAATSLAVKTLNDKINSTNNDVNNLSSLVSNVSQSVSDVTSDVSSLNSDVQSLQTRTRNLESEVNGIASNAENISSLQSQISNIQSAHNTLSTTVDNQGSDIETIKTDIDTLKLAAGDTSAINGLETRVEELENSVGNVANTVGVFKYNSDNDYLAGMIVDYNNNLYRAVVPQGEESNKVLAGTIPGVTGSENYWVLIDSDIRESLSNLGSSISDFHDAIDNAVSKADEVDNKVNNTNDSVNTLSNRVDAVKEDIDKFKGVYKYVEGVEYEADEIIEFNDTLYKSLTVTSSSPADVPSDWKKLSGDVDLSGVESRLTSLETNGTSVDSRLTTLESNKTNVESRLGNVESAIKTLEAGGADVSTLATKNELTSVSDRVQALEDVDHSDFASQTDLETLEQKVKSLEENSSGLDAWSNEKTYQSGNVVIHNDKIYQATATSLNSEPSDSNANWKEISESEASTLLTSINAVSDRVQALEGIDHSQYALKSDIPEAQDLTGYAKTADVEATYAKKTDIPEPTDTSTLATKAELSDYAKKTDIPSTSNLATKTEVNAIDSRVQALESSGSGSSGSAAAYQHYLVSGMMDGGATDSEDIGQNDWNVAYTATGPAFKSINISSDHRIITIDFDSKYDIRAFRVDVYKDFLAGDGSRLIRFTLDGEIHDWSVARYYPMGWSAKAGCYNVAGTGDTKIMNQVNGRNPYELQWTPTSIGEGLSFYVKM
jgi:chromosome segregation ATPase